MKTIIIIITYISLLSLITSPCPEIKALKNEIKNGYVTRYWDCCKPHCSWSENAGEAGASSFCNFSQEKILEGGSVCYGGPATTCLSQIPFTIDDCEYGFVFAAAPGSAGNTCGKCYKLDLDIGKTLIVMATNIGWDVQGGQFALMIPGGGAGLDNGCKTWDSSKLGAPVGGLLTDCGAGNADCLREKCNEAFENEELARKGCLFLADFMNAADNPRTTYQEVECPDVLIEKY